MTTFTLKSTAFDHRTEIPRRYTCEGVNISPPLTWEGIPDGARSLALIVDDPDAPDPEAPRTTWVHWVVYNIPPETRSLAERAVDLPATAEVGANDWKRCEYGGPCPPIGRHRYFFKLYALDSVLRDLNAPTKRQLEAAMRGHVLAEAQLVGTYEKHR